MLTMVEPVITLEGVNIRAIHLTSLDLEVKLNVQNPNPIDAILRELPFTVFFRAGNRREEIAAGAAGRLEIPANGSTDIVASVTSYDLALIEALATIVEKGGIRLEIQGNAVIDHILGWTLPFTETVNVTERQVLDVVEGKTEAKKGL